MISILNDEDIIYESPEKVKRTTVSTPYISVDVKEKRKLNKMLNTNPDDLNLFLFLVMQT